ncbi:hypothetical protein MMC28_011528 [Mycoblastus sanguinarius]|nr:hypothetical protein [Mycoblastus sanguinarius]
MSPTILALTAPVDLSALPSNPALKWYMHYVAVFDADIHTAAKQPTRFYSSQTVNYSANGTVIRGAQAVWDDYLFLWGSFHKLTRELRTIIFVSDEDKGTHVVHAEAVTVCHLKGGKGAVGVPTSFVYTLDKAEEGAGEGGLQIWEIRSYLDLKTLERAKAMQE